MIASQIFAYNNSSPDDKTKKTDINYKKYITKLRNDKEKRRAIRT